jgi:hypothetical protein
LRTARPARGTLTAGRAFSLGLRWAFGAGLDRRERNAAALLIDVDDPHLEHIPNADDLVRIADIAVGQPADMHQAAVRESDIDERAEIDDVEHGAL